MKAKIYVTLKKGVLDPQGAAVLHALHSLNFNGVNAVRQGKFFELDLTSKSKAEAEGEVRQMSEKLLANLVIEDFHFEVSE